MEYLFASVLLGVLSLLVGWLLWWWNELCYVLPHKWRNSVAAKLPPGHLGLPFNGEMLAFLWYFKILRRPDKFIDAMRKKYGDGVGLYRTYLFGSPSNIAWFPSVNRFVLQDDALLKAWPNVDIFGSTYLVTVHGNSHARLRSYVTNAINQPEALRQITLLVQPCIVAALQSWSQKGRVKAYDETKKVTFENIGKLFASLEPGALLDAVGKLFAGLVKGVRAHRLNIPGSAYHHALQYRKKLEAIFRVELEKKKRQKCEGTNYDLMDGLMQIEDGEGSKLSHQEVLDNIICLVIGGYEFTSLASMWAIYYLVNYPDVLEKLRVCMTMSSPKEIQQRLVSPIFQRRHSVIAEENVAISQKKKGGLITSCGRNHKNGQHCSTTYMLRLVQLIQVIPEII